MDEDASMNLVFLLAGGVLATVLLGAGILYAIDFRVDATVQETRCETGEVLVETKMFGIDHTVRDVPAAQCSRLDPGNFVQYRIRSQRTTLYESEGGDCIYDSKTGPDCGEDRGGLLGLA